LALHVRVFSLSLSLFIFFVVFWFFLPWRPQVQLLADLGPVCGSAPPPRAAVLRRGRRLLHLRQRCRDWEALVFARAGV